MSLILSILRVRFAGLLRLRPANRPMRLECLGASCGLCCKVMGGEVVVTDAEAQAIENFLLKKKSGVFTLKANGCSCALLVDGMCSRYDARPKGCKDYPWYSIGESLYYDSGCPGMHDDEDGRPDVSAIRGLETYLSDIPFILRRFMTWVLTFW